MLKKKVILIITDSLGFPRSEPELVTYHDTYISILREKYPHIDIIHHGIGGATIKDIFNFLFYFRNTIKPDLVFIQCGIVDCAPRMYGKFQLLVAKYVSSWGRYPKIWCKLAGKILYKIRLKQYTPIAQFADYLEQIINIYDNSYFMTILGASTDYESVKPGITAQIERYNSVIYKFNHVDLSNIKEVSIMTDGHHLNIEGHLQVSEKLSQMIKENGI